VPGHVLRQAHIHRQQGGREDGDDQAAEAAMASWDGKLRTVYDGKTTGLLGRS
jgi:hypothetical protein